MQIELTHFRYMCFQEGNPRIQEIEFNNGLVLQVIDGDLPPGWPGITDPDWYFISHLPEWVRTKLLLSKAYVFPSKPEDLL